MVYGAGGAIGSAVALAFAREGARIFLAGRSRAKLERVAEEIHAKGGTADTAIVDALDEKAVDAYVDHVVLQAGAIDISFNLISYGDVQVPLMELSVDDFLQPITIAMRSHFLTSRAAARHMIQHGSGVILAFGGGGPQLCRDWAALKSPSTPSKSSPAVGLRTRSTRHPCHYLKTGGVVETLPADFPGRDEIIESIQKAV